MDRRRTRIIFFALCLFVALGCTRKGAESDRPVIVPLGESTEQPVGQSVEVAVCVTSTVAGQNVDQTAAVVRDSILNHVAHHPSWPGYLGAQQKKQVRVDVGCPGTPFLLQPDARPDAVPPPVTHPTGYRSYIVVLPEGDIAQLFSSTSRRTVPQEVTCQSLNCGEVATALYLSPTELGDAAFLEQGLLRVLGVVPPTPGW